MDERLQKKYGHLFKFLKLVVEMLILPIIFWCISSDVVSFLIKDIEDNNNTFLYFISKFNEIIISFVRVLSESLSWLDLVSLFVIILLLVIFIFRPHLIHLFCKPNGIRRALLKSIFWCILWRFFILVIIYLATFYFAAIDKFSTQNFFKSEFSSAASSRIEALGLISAYYLTWSALSRIVVNFFLSEEVTKRLFRVLAYLDYDKGYMNYYYLGKIKKTSKKFSESFSELRRLVLQSNGNFTSSPIQKKLKKVRKYWKIINDTSNSRDKLLENN